MNGAIMFVTGNKGKLVEAKSVIPSIVQLDVDLPEIQETDPRKVIEAKLREAFKYGSGRFMVEDTSLYLDCQKGFPGPLIKWYLKALCNKGLYELVRMYGNYGAEARTVIGYAESPDKIHYFEGSARGKVVAPAGGAGFGWDPIFQPDGHSKSFAELDPVEKNRIGMRRIAVEKLKAYIESGERDSVVSPLKKAGGELYEV